MSLASTAFTCSPVSMVVEDETEVTTCESAFACMAKKGLVFASDLVFMHVSIVEVIKGINRSGYDLSPDLLMIADG